MKLKILPQWQFGLLLLTFIVAFFPVLSKLVALWFHEADYSHGFMVIPVVIFLIWQKKNELHGDLKKTGHSGIFAVFVAIISVFVGEISGFRMLEYIAFILLIWASVLYLYGFDVLKKIIWELVFLFFMIPIPSSVYARITLPLQIITTKLTAHVLTFFKIPVFREGNVIQLMNTTLEVVNACSGLRSLLSVLALAYIIGILSFKKIGMRLVMLLAGVIIAVVVNVFRVSTIAVSSHYGYSELSNGLPHELLGLFLFCFSFFAIFTMEKVLNWVFPEK